MIESIDIPEGINTEKFFLKINIDQETLCWNWTGAITKQGYGHHCFKYKTYRAHRVSYFIFKGNTTNGLVIDHICRNRKCVNPDHLREVDMKTNSNENAMSASYINSSKTHCKRGHEFTPENTKMIRQGNRFSRSCVLCSKLYYNKRNKT